MKRVDRPIPVSLCGRLLQGLWAAAWIRRAGATHEQTALAGPRCAQTGLLTIAEGAENTRIRYPPPITKIAGVAQGNHRWRPRLGRRF